MQSLINEYRQSLREFKKSKVDTYKAGMIGDTTFSIRYMETGRYPDTKWLVPRMPGKEKEISVDPFMLNEIFESNEPVRRSSDSDYELVEELLHCLSEREKDVYKMVHGEMFSWEQTAKILGISKSTVQYHLREASKKLNRAFAY